jgi:uncharacterized protein
MKSNLSEQIEFAKDTIVNNIVRDGNWRNEIVYLCLSGSHLYGYASENSDIDVRGCYIMPLDRALGIGHTRYSIERNINLAGVPLLDIQVFDIKKEVELLMANNSNVFEHVFADPIATSNDHTRLKNFARKVLTTRIYQPYRGIAISSFEKFIKSPIENGKSGEITCKQMFYVFRPLMAGIYALETGKIESNLVKLCDYFDDTIIANLVNTHIGENESGFDKLTMAKYVDMIQNYFIHIDFAAQESSKLYHDDGTADQKERQAFKEEIFFDANELIKSMRLKKGDD